MARSLGIGIIGAGNISSTYLNLAPLFKGIKVQAIADINAVAAQHRAGEHGIEARSMDALLASDDVDIVVNLTVPDAHFDVSKQILSAGKHLYSEKPLTLSLKDGLELQKLAEKKKLKAGCAPDTFLGGAHQLARKLVDDGEVGTITSGTAHVLSHGMEHWHPNPDFFFRPGGGPILDLGPYYIANLVNLIGPVRRVAALTSMASTTRTISSFPRKGEVIDVTTPTTIQALLEFASGATVTLSASWDVWAHHHPNMELYGTDGSIFLPDPNFFGGEVKLAKPGKKVKPVKAWSHPFGIANQKHAAGMMANYRTAGLADMAAAIIEGRDIRCSLERALHGVDVMVSILRSGEEKKFIDIRTSCSRPEALGIKDAKSLLKKP
ncbi:Gfo/Idh/MocA family protein [Phyllobacterium pellucidum]|uniref:Gfo/Idh/MocA family protein n=1 Tax=Phyllobacterium pellucidum TaxID=2740464 RepID=UPI001D14C76E|nr:Gfo/Idh/MocA family oxidoreductase [Phyllobacterium sp. T1018]UGY11676.1 Gfo/Idh/MocA family oxidoreductase [Phyllobacterium sp. T1018]